jgi:sugar phosphate isomerase/epimerase
MTRLYSLAYLTSHRCGVAEALRVAAQQGYSSIGERLLPNGPGGPYQELIGHPQLLRDAQAMQRDTGVSVFDVEIVRIGADFRPQDYLPLFEAGAALGAQRVLVAGDDTDESRLTASYTALCAALQPYGMTADLEFMPWTAVANAQTALRIVQQAGMPSNAGILVDPLHVGRSSTSLDDIRAIPNELLHYAQICDAQGGLHFSTDELIHTARCERLHPGQGTIDVRGLFQSLPPQLPVSVEVIHLKREASISPAEWAGLCLRHSRAFLGD